MNKWLVRILGILIIAIVAVIFSDSWFNPKIPDRLYSGGQVVLKDTTDNSLNSHTSARVSQTDNANLENSNAAQSVSNTLTLTSLDELENTDDESKSVDKTQHDVVQSEDKQSVQNQAKALSPQEKQSAPQQKSVSTSTSKNKPAERSITKADTPSENRKNQVWIQVGAFESQANADLRVNKVKRLGLPVSVETAVVNQKAYHRVYVGPMLPNQVDSALKQLSNQGIQGQQVSRK